MSKPLIVEVGKWYWARGQGGNGECVKVRVKSLADSHVIGSGYWVHTQMQPVESLVCEVSEGDIPHWWNPWTW